MFTSDVHLCLLLEVLWLGEERGHGEDTLHGEITKPRRFYSFQAGSLKRKFSIYCYLTEIVRSAPVVKFT